MKIKAQIVIYQLIIFLFCFSCKSGKERLNKETRTIVKVILEDYDSIALIRETYYHDSSIKPINLLYPYYRAYSYSIMDNNKSKKKQNIAYVVFLKDVDGIIIEKELDKMKDEYKSWSIEGWDEKNIENKKVKLISLDSVKKYDISIPTVRLSEPLFTKDKKKAIIYESYLDSKTGAHGIRILVKKNGKWVIKGGIPVGTSN